MTDAFTTAARARAATDYAVDWEEPPRFADTDRQDAEHFLAGAEWARAHIAAQDTARAREHRTCPTCGGDVHVDVAGVIWTTTNSPTDAEVEAAAEAIIGASFGQELPEDPITLASEALRAARTATHQEDA